MRASVVRAARRGVTLGDAAVYAVILAVLRAAFDASLRTLAAIGVAFVVLEVVDELKAQPGVDPHLVTTVVALVLGVAVLAILVVEGLSLVFLALLAGSAWLLYDGVSSYRADEPPDATGSVDHE